MVRRPLIESKTVHDTMILEICYWNWKVKTNPKHISYYFIDTAYPSYCIKYERQSKSSIKTIQKQNSTIRRPVEILVADLKKQIHNMTTSQLSTDNPSTGVTRSIFSKFHG